MKRWIVGPAAFAVLLALGGGSRAYADLIAELPIPVKATYLHGDSYDSGAQATVPLTLSDLGIDPGDPLLLEALGDFDRGTSYVDDFKMMIGVFSGSAVLLAKSELNRVQDAIDAGEDVDTPKTWAYNELTNISEDFSIHHVSDDDQTVVTVPAGATHLFISARDSLYYDNTDPDADFGVRISVVPEPSTLTLLTMGALALTVGWRRRRAA